MTSIANKIPRCTFSVFWGTVSIVYALLFEGTEFAGSPVAGSHGLMILVMQWCVVSLSASTVIGLISLSRKIFAALFPLLLTISVIAAYFKLTLGVSVTPGVIELMAVNEMDTWAELVTLELIVIVSIAMIIGALLAAYRYQCVKKPRKAFLWAIAFAAGVVIPVCFVPRLKAPVTARMPYSFWFSVKEYMANRKAIIEERHTFDDVSVTCKADSMTVVVVVGESLRADHLSLNGYPRVTTPRLEAETTLVSIPKMWTDACYTHLSVPYIMTRADSINNERAFTEQSFITLFKNAGFNTAWFSNQDAVDSYVYFMHEADTLMQFNSGRSLYDYGKWLDADMLPKIADFFTEKNPKKLAVVHTIGSHWWYRSHYSASQARFRPEIDSRIVSELSLESMRNSYDNTILATDAFVADIADQLRDRCAVIIFISDHGESLGESGKFLHAVDADELHHTACFVWFSDIFARHYPEKIAALRCNSRKQQRTDVIFHTALDAADINASVKIPSLSLFRQ